MSYDKYRTEQSYATYPNTSRISTRADRFPPLINNKYETRWENFLRINNNYVKKDPHGNSAWETHYDLQKFNFFYEKGIPLGLSTNKYYATNKNDICLFDTIRYTGNKHLLTIAPSGSGKGTAVQIPVLLEYDASIFMIDPKGENAIITASYRKNVLKQNVFILNPFGVLKEELKQQGLEQHGFNPLATLDLKDVNFVADVAALSEALITNEGNDPYWSNAARELISCLIMYICTNGNMLTEDKNLKKMRELLTQPEEDLLTLLKSVVSSNDNFKPLRQKASLFANSSKGNAAIISTAITQTSFLDDPRLSDNLCMDDVNFSDLKQDGNATVFLILPARFMVAYSKWFRVLVTSALDTLMSAPKTSSRSVLFMLDECATIGYLPSIETAIGLARGYGIQIWSFFQDIHQIKAIYGNRAESFLANAGIHQYFVPNDIELAERISKRIGNTTITVQSNSQSNGTSNIYGSTTQSQSQSNSSHSQNEIGVPLIQPNDVIGMHYDGQILFFEGNKNPIYAIKNYYYNDFSIYDRENRYQPNPYF
jgi:type IV secretion system protein VirD4